MSPTSYCDCGPSETYPTLPPTSSGATRANCAYTSLDPAKTIQPVTTTSPPTNIPGMAGLGACHGYGFGDDTAPDQCPYALDGWCVCNGVTVAPLPATESNYINCAYTLQPTAGACPINTAYSASLAAASSASVASAASAASASWVAAQPTQTASNNKGSVLCDTIGSQTCKNAYSYYNDDYTYKEYTSYLQNSGDSSIINVLFPANNGCTAKFSCKNDDAYAKGMTGKQIKAAFDNLFAHDDVSTCGTSELSNDCSVSVDGCNDCKPNIPCDALPLKSLQDGYPCNGVRPPDGLDRTCKLRVTFGGGRAAVVTSRTCECTDGSKPNPFISGALYHCPDEAPDND